MQADARQYRIGDVETVPCIRSSWAGSPVGWLPVVGPPHQDTDLQPTSRLHYHVDPRFLPLELRSLQRHTRAGWVPRIFDTPLHTAMPVDQPRFFVLGALLPVRGVDSSWFRHLPRRVLAQWQIPHLSSPFLLQALEVKYADAHMVNNRCPHWGVDISSVPPSSDGTRSCPLHGLRWAPTGRLAPWSGVLMQAFAQAEAHEVRRRLREDPEDPEFRAWANTQLNGHLRVDPAPLPTAPAQGLDEQDVVSDEESAPVPPLPPHNVLARGRRALAVAEAEAARLRGVVEDAQTRMAADGHVVMHGETLLRASWAWQVLVYTWEVQQAARDRIVADIQVLVAVAEALDDGGAVPPR